MKKTLFIAAILTLFCVRFSVAEARPVDVDKAMKKAQTFWNANRPAGVAPAESVKPLAFAGLDQMHIFDINGTGFVIVAADDNVRSILAYSFENTFSSELNPETAYWLYGYNGQIADAAKSDATAGDPDSTASHRVVLPLVKTKWDQGDPYNTYCPYDSTHHARTVVGCVATAMAQIMKYWNYPYRGEGSHSYWHPNYGELSADFGSATYLWHIMPNSASFSTQTCRNAAALISYHCGIAVDMWYGPSSTGGSGAYSYCSDRNSACVVNAFIDNFKYDPDLYQLRRHEASESLWLALVDSNLYARQPIYYTGSDSTGGHAFIFDGVDTTGLYHINWGWGGSCDGYYPISNLAPAPGGIGGNATYTFNQSQGAVFGIRPGQEEVFDTVDYYDTICNNESYAHFHNYDILAVNFANSGNDTLLHHLDTVFHYYLTSIPTKQLMLSANNGTSERQIVTYCPAHGYTFPECSFTKEGYTFFGWCRNKTGDNVIYHPGETAFFYDNPTFYALWIDNSQLGVDPQIAGSELIVWPTMTNDQVTLLLSGADGYQVSVIDALGRVMIQQNMCGERGQISVRELPAGSYLILVSTPKGIYKRRIIKL